METAGRNKQHPGKELEPSGEFIRLKISDWGATATLFAAKVKNVIGLNQIKFARKNFPGIFLDPKI